MSRDIIEDNVEKHLDEVISSVRSIDKRKIRDKPAAFSPTIVLSQVNAIFTGLHDAYKAHRSHDRFQR